MLTCIVLCTVDRARVNDVAEALAAIDGVSEVYSVTGRYDLVAILRVPSHEALAEIVTGGMLAVEGIRSTETQLALRVVSRHDLEEMFAIGMDEG
jgi:DNA-binding Lrp family transcriptional regulator